MNKLDFLEYQDTISNKYTPQKTVQFFWGGIISQLYTW
jgi:hypothetical protein